VGIEVLYDFRNKKIPRVLVDEALKTIFADNF
jgi:hypothetical protein